MHINGLLPCSPIHHYTCLLSTVPSKPNSKTNLSPSPAHSLNLRDHEHINHTIPSQSRSPSAQSVQNEDKVDDPLSLLNRIGRNPSLSVNECRQVHGHLVKLDALGGDGVVGNLLVKGYLRNEESLGDARKVFDELPKRAMSCYSALIGSYCREKRWGEVFCVFGRMLADGVLPDRYLVPRILKACSALGMGRFGRMVHGFGLRRGMFDDVYVGNAFVDVYASCGELRYARSVFDGMSERDVVSWTSLVVAYLNEGLVEEGADAFLTMQSEGLEPDLISWSAFVSGLARNGEIEWALESVREMEEMGLMANINTWNGIISGCVESKCYEHAWDLFCQLLMDCKATNPITVVNALSACSGLGDVKLGMLVHAYTLKLELCENIRVASSLLNMYTKCGSFDQAEKVFVRMDKRNTHVWNEMIAANVSGGKSSVAMELFQSMQDRGIRPDEITYNTLLCLHVKDGKKDEAYELLSEMISAGLQPTVVTFNILISGFQQCGLSQEALSLFQAMQLLPSDHSRQLMEAPIKPNHVTISGALAVCSDLEFLLPGRAIHGFVVKNNLESNVFVSSALVDMYTKCHDMDAAKDVFWRMENRNTVTWNVLMSACVANMQPFEAFNLFKRMLGDEIEPSHVSFMILIRACGDIAALSYGRVLHSYVIKMGFCGSKDKLVCTLIDMYAKCGRLSEAEILFDLETRKDVAIWNSLISSFAAYGMAMNAIALFERMEVSGVAPDNVTFVALLSACAHNGLSEEAWKYFDSMSRTYGIVPSLEHYTCMVSLMGSSGLVDEALEFVRKMPYEPDACTWATLLKASRLHSNPEVGERAARALFELEPGNASNYILLSNIYAEAGLWDSSRSLRAMVKSHSALKECSSVDICHDIKIFQGGKHSTPLLEDIMATWDELAGQMKLVGCTPLDPVIGADEDPSPLSCLHTEKLAICCGIISLNAFQTVRVSKNNRMCIDCHTSAKLITKITRRDIFVKDAGFYHHMQEGVCSCCDKW